MLRNVWHMFHGLPGLMRIGLLLLAAGGSLDIIHHTAPLASTMHLRDYPSGDELLAHVVTLAGMVVTLLGLLMRPSRRHAGHGRSSKVEGR